MRRWDRIYRAAHTVFVSPLQWAITSSVIYTSMVALQFLGKDGHFAPGPKAVFLAAEGIAANVVASFILYYLVVVLPERRKRSRLRNTCRKMYRALKQDIIYAIMSASWQGGRKDLDFGSEEMKRLLHPVAFREVFEEGKEADEGFCAFSNHIQNNEKEFRSIVFQFKLIARQLEFVLNNCDVLDQNDFLLLKRLEQTLYALDDLHAGYEDEKALSKIIWEVFAGWSWIDGYRDFDIIERAIDHI